MIPAKGTTARMILDHISTAKCMDYANLFRRMSASINKSTVQNLVEIEVQRGNLRERAQAFYLTERAKKAMADEAALSVENRDYTMRPLSAKHIVSPLGMREGSNEFRAWPSRHV